MEQFKIYTKQSIGYTYVSNQFIDQYMLDANDAQIKIYLYLLRQMNAGLGTGICRLADYFNYTEKDIIRALHYWEQKKLLELEYTADHQICGIMICQPEADDTSRFGSRTPASLLFPEQTSPSPADGTASTAEGTTVSTADRTIGSAAEGTPSPTIGFVRPEYSAEQLAEFQARSRTSELIFIAESYLGKTLSRPEIECLMFLSDVLHFSFDLIDYLLQYCVDRDKKSFRYIEKVAIRWAEAKVVTPADAKTHSSRYDRQIYSVMNALGKTTTPTPREAEYIKRWYSVYGFTSEVILEACERTVLATDTHRFSYADKILSSWQKAGVHHKADIARLDASFRQKKPAAAPEPKNKFYFTNQNQYDYDALEKEFLQN